MTAAATKPAPPLLLSKRIWARPLAAKCFLLSDTPTNPTGMPITKLGAGAPAATCCNSTSRAVGALPISTTGAGDASASARQACSMPAAVRVEPAGAASGAHGAGVGA